MGWALLHDRPHDAGDRLEASAGSYWLKYGVGTTAEEVIAALPAGVEILRAPEPRPPGFRWVEVAVGQNGLRGLVEQDSALLEIEPEAEDLLSDEHQGQILARNYSYDDVADEYVIDGPSYLTWLANRGLRGETNQQTIAIFDSGYDDGTPAPRPDPQFCATPAHPDLRITLPADCSDSNVGQHSRFFTGEPPNEEHYYYDDEGHGTMVAGIISGVDTDDIYGTGIAPDAFLFNVKTSEMSPTCVRSVRRDEEDLEKGLDASRGAGGALIASNSWNKGNFGYGLYSQRYDGWVRDATSLEEDSVEKPMTMVFSAGNFGPGYGTILSPANAKNVIAVGSTDNIQPFGELEPVTCDDWTNLTSDDNPVNPNEVSSFSSRGAAFGPGEGVGLHEVRIKPDVVAPGWRIFSTVPWATTSADTYICSSVCAEPYSPMDDLHNYGRGTSFAAPAVAGAAALFMKYHMDSVGRAAPLGGPIPSPTLVKAALIATADSLTDLSSPDCEGELCPCVDNDCRPSPHSGWGRINLDRLTNGVDRFYRNEVSFDAVETGESRSWTRKVDDSDEDILIVLTWTDEVGSTLQNDLDLTVWGPTNPPPGPPGTPVWFGNTFPENYPDAETGADGWGYSVELYPNLPPGEGDSANNVEAVFIYNAGSWPAGSGFQIVVSAANAPLGQDFSVYAYNLRFSQIGP